MGLSGCGPWHTACGSAGYPSNNPMKKLIGFALAVCAACSESSPTAPTQSAAPVISNISVSALTASSAQLTWITDKESDSQAEYGTTTSYGTMSPAVNDPVTSHSVTIEGLEQATSYHYRVRSRDKDGNLAFSENLTFATPAPEPPPAAPPPPPPLPPSKKAPVVAVTRPISGATVSGRITIAANATDNVGVMGVQFKRNGSNLGSEDKTAPYSIEWDTKGAANGTHTITAVARDKSASTTSTAVTITVSNSGPDQSDTTSPAVSVSAPAGGSTASGTITVTANASDNVGVAGVQFKVDGVDVGAEDTGAPYSVQWNTTSAANGNHGITAVARDGAGNSTTSESVTVVVSNAPGNPGDSTAPSVSVTAPAANATLSGTVTVTAAATDNVGVAGVQFKVDGVDVGAEDTGAPYSVQWNTTAAANGNHGITAVARDAAGNNSTSTNIAVTVVNDQAPPSVSITAPTVGATLSGTLAVTATASDDLGVAGVQIKLNGINLGAEDTAAPYSVSWNTTTAINGSHALTAIARDGANKTTTSAAVSVAVNNIVLPPPGGGTWPNEPGG
jgi:chitodextrinase